MSLVAVYKNFFRGGSFRHRSQTFELALAPTSSSLCKSTSEQMVHSTNRNCILWWSSFIDDLANCCSCRGPKSLYRSFCQYSLALTLTLVTSSATTVADDARAGGVAATTAYKKRVVMLVTLRLQNIKITILSKKPNKTKHTCEDKLLCRSLLLTRCWCAFWFALDCE